MKPYFFTIILCFTALHGCGKMTDQPAFALSGESDHFPAGNCEIFVDKVRTTNSSHGTHGITFYVKTLNERLDGAIAEVGLRQQVTSQHHGQQQNVSDWHDEPATPYFGAGDYFELYVYLGSSYQDRHGTGAFYVRTVRGTTYWLQPDPGENYQIGNQMFSSIRDLYGPFFLSYSMIPTQNQQNLTALNPGRCY